MCRFKSCEEGARCGSHPGAIRVPDKLDATRKATLRALKLFCVGRVLQGGFFHGVRSLTFGVDIAQIRLMGILQRIAIAYLVTTLCQTWLKGEDDVDSRLDLIKRYRYQFIVLLDLQACSSQSPTWPSCMVPTFPTRRKRSMSNAVYEVTLGEAAMQLA
ncbi:hypothetical protein D1007_23118 [Hordeum vulgare]|nr:hypothetical protein D1007_23118 [Hordeum vulgare]